MKESILFVNLNYNKALVFCIQRSIPEKNPIYYFKPLTT